MTTQLKVLLYIYIDGVQEATATNTNSTGDFDGNNEFSIGMNNLNSYFLGKYELES